MEHREAEILSVIDENVKNITTESRVYINRLFDRMPEELQKYARVRMIPKGTVFIEESKPVEKIYVLLSGIVMAYEHRVLGIRYDFIVFQPVKSFGAMEVLLDIPEYKTTLHTKTDCWFIEMDKKWYSEWIFGDINALAMETKSMGTYLLEEGRKERLFMFLQGKERMLMFLSMLYGEEKDDKGVCTIAWSREEWADSLGLSLRTVGRVIKTVTEEGYVNHYRNRIMIHREQYEKIMDYLNMITEV